VFTAAKETENRVRERERERVGDTFAFNFSEKHCTFNGSQFYSSQTLLLYLNVI